MYTTIVHDFPDDHGPHTWYHKYIKGTRVHGWVKVGRRDKRRLLGSEGCWSELPSPLRTLININTPFWLVELF